MTQSEKGKEKGTSVRNVFITSLIAGGAAGTFVDVALYPLDTLKTRLQSAQGFLKTGGFTGLYKGILPVIVGSAPTAALFFLTYEEIKTIMQPRISADYYTPLHMGAATVGEMVACLLRVPVEVMKQRKQAQICDKKSLDLRILYRGYWTTVLRDSPFSIVQFPLWEYLKKSCSFYVEREIYPVESAICGAIAGSISAAVTTPLDVVKTRIMLANRTLLSSELRILNVLHEVYLQKGFRGCKSACQRNSARVVHNNVYSTKLGNSILYCINHLLLIAYIHNASSCSINGTRQLWVWFGSFCRNNDICTIFCRFQSYALPNSS